MKNKAALTQVLGLFKNSKISVSFPLLGAPKALFIFHVTFALLGLLKIFHLFCFVFSLDWAFFPQKMTTRVATQMSHRPTISTNQIAPIVRWRHKAKIYQENEIFTQIPNFKAQSHYYSAKYVNFSNKNTVDPATAHMFHILFFFST